MFIANLLWVILLCLLSALSMYWQVEAYRRTGHKYHLLSTILSIVLILVLIVAFMTFVNRTATETSVVYKVEPNNVPVAIESLEYKRTDRGRDSFARFGLVDNRGESFLHPKL